MSSTPPANPLNHNEENSTTLDYVVQPPTGPSAEEIQQIATAMAALVGHPSSSNNPLVSSPLQVPTPPTVGMEFVYHVVYSWCNFNPALLSSLSQITELMRAYSTFLRLRTVDIVWSQFVKSARHKNLSFWNHLTDCLLGWSNSSATAVTECVAVRQIYWHCHYPV